jgi:hypothetical protein
MKTDVMSLIMIQRVMMISKILSSTIPKINMMKPISSFLGIKNLLINQTWEEDINLIQKFNFLVTANHFLPILKANSCNSNNLISHINNHTNRVLASVNHSRNHIHNKFNNSLRLRYNPNYCYINNRLLILMPNNNRLKRKDRYYFNSKFLSVRINNIKSLIRISLQIM